jgi:hypothetical protein
MTVILNTPFLASFDFPRCSFSDVKLNQLHKLSRNFCASLDLGCPSAKHTSVIDDESTDSLDERQKYLLWVRRWKVIYREVSQLIRLFKQRRKITRFPKLSEAQREQVKALRSNQEPVEYLRNLAYSQLPVLQETAMALLNARYNAKLASAERRRRLRERSGNASAFNSDDVGSNPAGATIVA